MSDFDAALPTRSIAADNTTKVADSAGTTIDPAKESGNLGTIKLNTDKLNVNLSTVATETTLAAISGKLNSLGQKTMANSVPVVVASDQSAIPVTFSNSTVETLTYSTASAIAAAASSTQTLSPGSTILLDKITASASGQMKVEIQWGTTASETTRAVFFTSKGSLYAEFNLPNPVSITNTMSVKVIRTNLDNQAMDVYSTIYNH